MKATFPLLAVLAVIWTVVWVTTQTLPNTPLGTAPTVAIGVASTLAAVLGYPSAIRGPRRRGSFSGATLDPPSGDPLTMVSRALPHLRDGLTEAAASGSAQVLLPLTGARHVELTNRTRLLGTTRELAPVSVDAATSREASASSTDQLSILPLRAASKAAISLGRSVERSEGDDTVVATPLLLNDEILGTLTVIYGPDDVVAPERIEALADLVSLYLEQADLNQQAQRAADAKLDALRAQINPHFLFNTLNTIASKNRTDPEEARSLLLRLADFFRYAVQQEGQFAEFAHEYFFVRTYLSLEQARYEERLKVHLDVDPQVLPAQVPVLTIQPLIENAVKHGIAPMPNGGTVTLKARVDPLAGAIRISVRDDGVGMATERLEEVVNGSIEQRDSGVGLRNIHERLEHLYGERYHIDIRSSPNRGTRVELELPL